MLRKIYRFSISFFWYSHSLTLSATPPGRMVLTITPVLRPPTIPNPRPEPSLCSSTVSICRKFSPSPACTCSLSNMKLRNKQNVKQLRLCIYKWLMSVFTVQDIRMYIYNSCNIELSFNEQFSFLRPKVSLQCPLFTFFVYPWQHLYSCNTSALVEILLRILSKILKDPNRILPQDPAKSCPRSCLRSYRILHRISARVLVGPSRCLKQII